MLTVSDKYEWYALRSLDLDLLRSMKNDCHLAIQNVSAVGRTFLEPVSNDRNASLNWIPGLWRLAGNWVSGIHKFRSSLSFDDFSIYLVDEKVNTLDSITLSEKSENQVLVWLEQHIISLNLSSSHLVMNPPYSLPPDLRDKKGFSLPDLDLIKDLGGYFHDAFILFSEYRQCHKDTSAIEVYPKRFNMEMRIILIETDEEETDTYITLGFCPGDKYYDEPYYYVTSRPHIMETVLPKFSTRGFWHKNNWFGSVYFTRNLWDSSDQKATAMYFFDESISMFQSMLT